MTSTDIDRLMRLFDEIDRDRSGTIDARELGTLLDAYASGTAEQVLAALASLETADPNRVTWDEFRTWWAGVSASRTKKPSPRQRAAAARPAPAVIDEERVEQDLQAVFTRFDRDKSGSIDARELASILEALGLEPDDDELRTIFARLDADKSGRISLDELRVWWNEEA
jgi:Ca2+-binding EF-hand superfamily protein